MEKLSLKKIVGLFEKGNFTLRKIYKTGKICKFLQMDSEGSCSSIFIKIPSTYEVTVREASHMHINIVQLDSEVFSYYSDFLKKIKPDSFSSIACLSQSNFYVQHLSSFEVYKLGANENDNAPEPPVNVSNSALNTGTNVNVNTALTESTLTEDSTINATSTVSTNETDLTDIIEDEEDNSPVEIIFLEDEVEKPRKKKKNKTDLCLGGLYIIYDLIQIYNKIKILQDEVKKDQDELYSSVLSFRKLKLVQIKNNTLKVFNNLQSNIASLESQERNVKIAADKLFDMYKNSSNEEHTSKIKNEICKLRNEDNKLHNKITAELVNYSNSIEHLLNKW